MVAASPQIVMGRSAPVLLAFPIGEGCVRPYCFSTHACIRSDDMGIAVLSYRSLPHWGRGTASAVDRVLSLMAYLRCISSLFFTPPSPSNLRPFGAPPSIGRREYPRKPLPLEGAAERSEAGLALFFWRRSRLLFAFPTQERLCFGDSGILVS